MNYWWQLGLPRGGWQSGPPRVLGEGRGGGLGAGKWRGAVRKARATGGQAGRLTAYQQMKQAFTPALSRGLTSTAPQNVPVQTSV